MTEAESYEDTSQHTFRNTSTVRFLKNASSYAAEARGEGQVGQRDSHQIQKAGKHLFQIARHTRGPWPTSNESGTQLAIIFPWSLRNQSVRINPLKDGVARKNSVALDGLIREMLHKRAAAIAVIHGRSEQEISKSDWEQAKRQLDGESDIDRLVFEDNQMHQSMQRRNL